MPFAFYNFYRCTKRDQSCVTLNCLSLQNKLYRTGIRMHKTKRHVFVLKIVRRTLQTDIPDHDAWNSVIPMNIGMFWVSVLKIVHRCYLSGQLNSNANPYSIKKRQIELSFYALTWRFNIVHGRFIDTRCPMFDTSLSEYLSNITIINSVMVRKARSALFIQYTFY